MGPRRRRARDSDQDLLRPAREGFGANLANGGFEQRDIEILDRRLNNFMISKWSAETFAHELHYNDNEAGRLGYSSDDSISLMAQEHRGPHIDAVHKFGWGWLDPEFVEPGPHTREIVLPPVYGAPRNALLIYPDREGHRDELFIVENRRRDAKNWEGKPTRWDKQLEADAEGLLIYHVNALNPSDAQPRIQVEGEAPGVRNIRAFTVGKLFTAPASNFWDGKLSGLSVYVDEIDAEGRARLRVSWGRNPGEAECYTIATHGPLLSADHAEGWRDSWSELVAGHFVNASSNDLLLYDRNAGEAEMYTFDNACDMHRRFRTTGWRKTWTELRRVSSSGFDQVLLYDEHCARPCPVNLRPQRSRAAVRLLAPGSGQGPRHPRRGRRGEPRLARP